MPCPKCGSRRTTIVTPRQPTGSRARIVEIGRAVWRGHECRECGHLFPSIQRIASQEEIEAHDEAA
jgi:transcriptional regulator NrdR family protein